VPPRGDATYATLADDARENRGGGVVQKEGRKGGGRSPKKEKKGKEDGPPRKEGTKVWRTKGNSAVGAKGREGVAGRGAAHKVREETSTLREGKNFVRGRI